MRDPRGAAPSRPALLWDAAIERALLAHRRGDVHYDCR